MKIESFQLKLINFLSEKNSKRLFILCFCMSALMFGFQNYNKGQKTLSSKVNPKSSIIKTSSEITDSKSSTTSTSLK